MTRHISLATIALCAIGLASAALAHDPAAETVKPVLVQPLANVPGQTLTAVLVTYPPGGTSPAHHHAGSVMAYILKGDVRSENSATGAVRVYHAGEAFFEPPGSDHLISENASATERASLLAVFVAEDGAVLKTND